MEIKPDCTKEEIEKLKELAGSRTAGIWLIKRAKVILQTIEGKSIDRMVNDLRVSPESIRKCIRSFNKIRMTYFAQPKRKPTNRESQVESILELLENPSLHNPELLDKLKIRYIGYSFSARQIQTIRDLIATKPDINRLMLSKEISRMFQIYHTNGALKTSWVTIMLKRMDMDNLIHLTNCRQSCKSVHLFKNSINKIDFSEPISPTYQSVMELEPIQFVMVKSKASFLIWNDSISKYHYIGQPQLFGAQIRYLIFGGRKLNMGEWPSTIKLNTLKKKRSNHTDISDQPVGEHFIGVIGFSACSWQLSSRDVFIGWDEQQRLKHIKLVVANSRFLIMPWIKCPNLASRILGGIIKQLPYDWEKKYHYKPVLIETFVQLNKFKGTCYLASNWVRAGNTKGYDLDTLKKRKGNIPEKAIFLYPLHKNFKKILCSD